MQDKSVNKRIVILAAFSAIAIIFGYVESLIPFSFGIPGVKLGLANLVIIVMLYSFDGISFKDILVVNVVRILTVGFLFGNMYGIIYSLCGGLFSLIVMYLVWKKNCFGIVGVSILGGISHNLAQLMVAMTVVEQLKIFYYFPVLLLAGTICGAALGFLGSLISERLKKIAIL